MGKNRHATNPFSLVEEDRRLRAFIERIGPPAAPTVRIYRIEVDGKRTRLGAMTLEVFDEEALRQECGSGTFLIRTVRSNGTFGPSRIIRIAPMISEQSSDVVPG